MELHTSQDDFDEVCRTSAQADKLTDHYYKLVVEGIPVVEHQSTYRMREGNLAGT